jgi:hypothetical protein
VVSGYGVLGDSDPPATVLYLESPALCRLRCGLWDAIEDGEWAEQHPNFIPHLTLGYGVDMAAAAPFKGQTIFFDRLVVAMGPQVVEYPLGVPEPEEPDGEAPMAPVVPATTTAAASISHVHTITGTSGFVVTSGQSTNAAGYGRPDRKEDDMATQIAVGDDVSWNDADGNEQTGTVVAIADDGSATVQPEGTDGPDAQVTVQVSLLKPAPAQGAPPAKGSAPPPPPPQRQAAPAASADAPEGFIGGTPASFDQTGQTAWRGVLIVEGTPSGDGRMIENGALTWRELPLPLMCMTENPVGGMGHDGAQLVGSITKVWRDGSNIWGEGVFDTGSPVGSEALRLVSEQFMRGVSADLDMVEVDFENPEPSLDAPLEEVLAWDPGLMIVTSGRVMGATLTVFPAFEEATIMLVDSPEGEALVASAGPAIIGAVARTWLPYEGQNALVACAGGGFPVAPPAAWFAKAHFDGPTPVKVGADGRISGHVADWKGCHISFLGRCVPPPRSPSGYRNFRTKQVLTAEGSMVATGSIYMDTVHPNLRMKASDAQAFYAHTGCAIGDVAVYEDEWGIQIAGAVRPTAAPEAVRALRGSDLSPDWRQVNGSRDMVGLLAVNVSGFITPEAIVASAGEADGGPTVRPGVPRVLMDPGTGEVRAMVASGGCSLRRRSPLALQVDRLEAEIAELKAAVRPIRAARWKPTVSG